MLETTIGVPLRTRPPVFTESQMPEPQALRDRLVHTVILTSGGTGAESNAQSHSYRGVGVRAYTAAPSDIPCPPSIHFSTILHIFMDQLWPNPLIFQQGCMEEEEESATKTL